MQSFITNCWNKYLNSFPDVNKDIYFTEEYVKLYEEPEKNKIALCYVCSENEFVLLMPIIRNNIKSEYFDFETPYGYGGPITNCSDKVWMSKALSEMYSFFKKEKYIAGFVRFHPLLKNYNFCTENINPYFDRFTVFINLEESLDEIWSNQITSKNRNMIRKAEKSGFSYYTDFKFENIDEFIRIYNITMQNVSADSFYFFNQQYYYGLKNKFKNNCFLGIIKNENKIVSAAILMYNSIYGHYHLAGSDSMFSGFGINNLLLWNAAKTLKEKKVLLFHLGGGTNSDEENSLFKFKKAFSNNQSRYYIGKIIFNEIQYKQLCNGWESDNPDKVDLYKNHLLRYRY